MPEEKHIRKNYQLELGNLKNTTNSGRNKVKMEKKKKFKNLAISLERAEVYL